MTLYNKEIDGYRQCDLKLPNNLNWDLRNQDIVRRFGDSIQKGGGAIPVWITYEHLGIGFTFLNSSWEDSANPITHITLFSRSKQP